MDEESRESGNNQHVMRVEKDEESKESAKANDQHHVMKMAGFEQYAEQLAAGAYDASSSPFKSNRMQM